MSLHQSSVYVGITGGGTLAGNLAERGGWRTPFFVLGAVGFAYALALTRLIVEPVRVIDPKIRGTVTGMMKTVGWAGASLAPVVAGSLGDRNGLGPAIASIAGVHLVAGAVALAAARLAGRLVGPH
jgi:hypothetical protein